jgi:hypothetical protein
VTGRTSGGGRRASPLRRRLRGALALLVALGALAFAGYVGLGAGEFERPNVVAALLVLTALVALWQANAVLR